MPASARAGAEDAGRGGTWSGSLIRGRRIDDRHVVAGPG